MSKAPLTGYDNAVAGGGVCKAGGGEACFEVFEYAAGTGELACASCNPTGQRPRGQSNLSLLRPGSGAPQFRQPANLAPQGQGRLFFESQDALAPATATAGSRTSMSGSPGGSGTAPRRAAACG